jgi:ADP-ribose pyrophosphatase
MNEPNPGNPNDKPTGAATGWQLLQTERLNETALLKWRRDQLKVEGKGDFDYSYIEKAQAVLIVPVTADGQMVLIRQYRYPVDEWCLEIPAGGTHDTGDAGLEEVARKELSEEIGATCAELEFITAFHAEPSMTDEKCHVYLALGVEMSREPHMEATERIEMQMVPVVEAFNMAREGKMKSGPCTLAVFLCQNALERHGFTTR